MGIDTSLHRSTESIIADELVIGIPEDEIKHHEITPLDLSPALSEYFDDDSLEEEIIEDSRLLTDNERQIGKLNELSSAVKISMVTHDGAQVGTDDLVRLKTGAESYMFSNGDYVKLEEALEAIDAKKAALMALGGALAGGVLFKLIKWIMSKFGKGGGGKDGAGGGGGKSSESSNKATNEDIKETAQEMATITRKSVEIEGDKDKLITLEMVASKLANFETNYKKIKTINQIDNKQDDGNGSTETFVELVGKKLGVEKLGESGQYEKDTKVELNKVLRAVIVTSAEHLDHISRAYITDRSSVVAYVNKLNAMKEDEEKLIGECSTITSLLAKPGTQQEAVYKQLAEKQVKRSQLFAQISAMEDKLTNSARSIPNLDYSQSIKVFNALNDFWVNDANITINEQNHKKLKELQDIIEKFNRNEAGVSKEDMGTEYYKNLGKLSESNGKLLVGYYTTREKFARSKAIYAQLYSTMSDICKSAAALNI